MSPYPDPTGHARATGSPTGSHDGDGTVGRHAHPGGVRRYGDGERRLPGRRSGVTL